MDAVRYWIAVAILVTMPPALLYWFAIHPFVGFWRGLGPRLTFTAVFVGYLGLAALLFAVREPLLAIRGGWSPVLGVVGGLLYAVAIVVELRTRRQLSFRTLMGVPEVDPDGPGPGLLTEGVYARTRNPRYLNVMIALAAFAVFVNYLAIWVMLALTVPALRLIVHWEEKELRERFGEAYAEYCRRVPRFLPRLG